MLTTLKNAFKIKELRDKVLFTLLMLVVIRFGSQLPVPGIKVELFQDWYASQAAALGFLDAITGGSFESMSILALSISPYITSSIVMQLLTIAIPKLEEMQRDGEDGRKKIASMTRYVTVILAVMQSTAMAIGFGRAGYMVQYNALSVITTVATLTAGSAFLMWVGERITEKGIGNGISVVLVINILASIPNDFRNLFEQFVFGKAPATSVLNAVIIFAVVIGMVVLVIYLNDALRKIPVQYASKTQGRKMVGGGQNSNIPMRVNTSGVIPVIFASSLLQFPIIISSFLGYNGTGTWNEIMKYMNSTYWLNPSQMKYSIGLLVYILLIIFFAYFYTSVTFNPLMIADNMKKQGGFIPGIRPGKPTSDYLNKVLNSIVFIGAIGLTIVAVVPFFFSGVFGAQVSFGGTSLIIIVSVILETLKQVESMMLVRNYKGFLES